MEKNPSSPTLIGTGDENTTYAVGVTVLVLGTSYYDTAQIQDGVTLYADDLRVNARNTILDVALGMSGGRSQNFGFNGVVLYNVIDDTTLAQVGAGASVTVGSSHVVYTNPLTRSHATNPFTGAIPPPSTPGSALVEATDNTYLVTIAGSVALGQKVGIAPRSRSTTSAARPRPSSATITTTRRLHHRPFGAGGNIQIDASNGGFLGAFAAAGREDMADAQHAAGAAAQPRSPR